MSLRVYWLSYSVFNAFQLNCFNLVDTCNIALILFFLNVMSQNLVFPPLSHNVTLRRPPLPPLRVTYFMEGPLSHSYLICSIEERTESCHSSKPPPCTGMKTKGRLRWGARWWIVKANKAMRGDGQRFDPTGLALPLPEALFYCGYVSNPVIPAPLYHS